MYEPPFDEYGVASAMDNHREALLLRTLLISISLLKIEGLQARLKREKRDLAALHRLLRYHPLRKLATFVNPCLK